MDEKRKARSGTALNLQANLIAGIFTVIPIAVVWFVLNFIFSTLFSLGSPIASALTQFVADHHPEAGALLNDKAFQWFVAVIVALLLLYTIGAIASRMIGKRLLGLLEKLIERIPLVETVYSASKKLIGVLQQPPGSAARVVMVEFPHPGMRALGLVMRVLPDATTGEELAAVFIPTAPNPTSGYLEFVPLSKLTATDMTMEQAMSMIVSGGAVTPDAIRTGGMAGN